MPFASPDAPERARRVKLMLFDVDGVLTDGTLWYGPAGEALKAFHSFDGHGIKMLAESGVRIGLLSGRSSAAVAARAAELGIQWMTRLDEQVMNAPKGHAEPAPAAVSLPPAAPPGPAEEAPLTLPFACSEPWSNLNINASGEVRPCCFNDVVLGDLTKQSIEEIWNGPGYTALRSDMAAGRVPPTCASCASSDMKGVLRQRSGAT